jgi:RNA polymerase sigma-70 factor, ECF subfamily
MSSAVSAATIKSNSEVIELDPYRSRQMRDEELVQRVRSGDRDAFSNLMQPHLSTVHSRVRSIVENDADAQDVVQESMICAFTKLHQLRTAKFFRAWIIQIAVNQARMKLRSRTVGARTESLDGENGDDGVGLPPRQIIDFRHSPWVYVERREIREKLNRALDRLPRAHREVFILREIRQFSVSETAAMLDITIAMVKTNLRRAKLRLQQMLMPFRRADSSRWCEDSSSVTNAYQEGKKLKRCPGSEAGLIPWEARLA